MKTKEEIVKWHTHNLSAFSLATYKKPVYDAMQEYADQECAAKDNEISRLNGIITEQQRLSNLVSGDLQNAKKEIQELREGGKALILELNDEVIRLRAEVERLNLIVKQLTNPVSIGTYDGAPKPSITTTSDGVDLVRWVAVELDRPLKIADAEQLLKEYDEAKASPPSSSLFPDRNPSNIPR